MLFDRNLIITLGCGAANQAFRKAGLEVEAIKGINFLLNPQQSLQPRAIVIRSTIIRDHSTEDVVKKIRSVWAFVDIIIWAPRSSAGLVLGAMKAGAKDVELKENANDLVDTVKKAMAQQKILPKINTPKKKNAQRYRFDNLVSKSPKMWEIFDHIEDIAASEATVLILGETGTGKELIARSIHKRSGRRGRFVAVNCAAVPENLIDSELFGHIKGAFTGANADKKGLFRYADCGSILLDEIGNMPLTAQHHLLRVLQESRIRPVGGHQEIEVNARVIAATSSPLEQSCSQGRFREDLLYRLDVFRISLPPLRERPEDIIFLFSHFAQKNAKNYGLSFPDVTSDFLDAIVEFSWPGNIRQLENITERLLLSCAGQKLNRVKFEKLVNPPITNHSKSYPSFLPNNQPLSLNINLPLDQAIAPSINQLERSYLEEVLAQNAGAIGKSADCAGINRRTMLRKLKFHGINKKQFKT